MLINFSLEADQLLNSLDGGKTQKSVQLLIHKSSKSFGIILKLHKLQHKKKKNCCIIKMKKGFCAEAKKTKHVNTLLTLITLLSRVGHLNAEDI